MSRSSDGLARVSVHSWTHQFKELFGEKPRREDLTIMATRIGDEEDMVRASLTSVHSTSS
jgi:hypothetical protein